MKKLTVIKILIVYFVSIIFVIIILILKLETQSKLTFENCLLNNCVLNYCFTGNVSLSSNDLSWSCMKCEFKCTPTYILLKYAVLWLLADVVPFAEQLIRFYLDILKLMIMYFYILLEWIIANVLRSVCNVITKIK